MAVKEEEEEEVLNHRTSKDGAFAYGLLPLKENLFKFEFVNNMHLYVGGYMYHRERKSKCLSFEEEDVSICVWLSGAIYHCQIKGRVIPLTLRSSN